MAGARLEIPLWDSIVQKQAGFENIPGSQPLAVLAERPMKWSRGWIFHAAAPKLSSATIRPDVRGSPSATC